jgi:methionine-rich copper-binding protein CopC
MRPITKNLADLAITVAVLGAVFLAVACQATSTSSPDAMMDKPDAMMMDKTPEAMMDKSSDGMMMKELPNHLRSPHFVSSTPKHGDVLKQAPSSVSINFDFVLSDKTTVNVTRDGTMVPLSSTAIASNKLSLTSTLGGASSNGVYLVAYNACWPDGSCHDGQFAFHVDSTQ